MASNNNNSSSMSAQAKQVMSNMKYEVAKEVGVNLKQGYNGDLTSREAGSVGGRMVQKMIEQVEQQMAGGR
nr:alpha/beta-type small acid-soluble spore protein [bacterium]